jgi:hypothetical protein
MYQKLLCVVFVVVVVGLTSSVRAVPFSIFPVQDAYVANDSQDGPAEIHSSDDGIHIRNTADPRRRVGFLKFDISELKAGDGFFSNVSFSIDGWDAGDVDVYGISEDLDSVDINTLTWNNAPGVQNDPTPALNSPVELDLADLVGPLMTFQIVRRARESTETSQELADFLNNDVDGVVAFLLAPAEEGDSGIILSIEETPAGERGTLLEGDFVKAVGFASDPGPANGAADVARDVILSWRPGEFADTHNVYFGTNFDDVNNANMSSPLMVGPAIDEPTYDAGRLEFGQTYFWRVDEVNAPPDTRVFKGKVWSFTVESFAYPISGDGISVSASSYEAGKEPENTINGSGLDDDAHSTETSTMWLTASGASEPAWIQYDLGKPYKLTEMLVWNYNGADILYWYGLKDVAVEHSTDGINWTQIDAVSEFATANGMADYTYNTVVPFGGVVAQYVKITAASNWSNGFLRQYGLSEVRFMQIPVHARQPYPDNKGTDAAIDVVLGWRAGREAAQHDIYFSANQEAVADGTAFIMTTEQIGYGPLSLDLGSTYYWRIDEVNNANVPAIWQGDTWSFTTSEYLVVDDFESYNDITPGEEGSNRIYLTWIDGFDNPTANGSTMGYPMPVFADDEHFVETEIVHGGEQSAPIFFDNTTASISEVTVNTSDLPVGKDWTVGAPESLVLWVYGDPNNTNTEQMYVKINNARANFDGDLTQAQWQEFSVDLASLDTDLSNVTTLTIGFDRTGATGGSGMVFVDDIWLYTPIDEQAVIE